MVQSQEFHRPPLRQVLEAYVSVTASTYTARAGDRLIGVNRAGTVTVTLPTAQLRAGRSYTVKDESGAAGTNNITVATEGSEAIDGGATDTISENYGSKTYYSDGTNWFTVPLLAAASHTLASHSAKAHSDLTGVTSDLHHAQSHTLASHSAKAHADLTGVTSDLHHAQSHTLDSHAAGTLQHEKGGLEADVNAGDGFVEIKAGATTVIKSNTAASAAPGTTDDASAGYAVGSVWIDTTNDKAYLSLDSTNSAAVWTEITQGGGGVSVKQGSFTRDSAAASGTQDITGVGFTVKAVAFVAADDADVEASMGFDDGTGAGGIQTRDGLTADTWAINAAESLRLITDGSNIYQGHITTLGSDGFTITWTKTGSPTGIINIYYLAIG